MAAETLGEVLRRIGRTAGLQGVLALTDAQLLERFAAGRDEPAFAALVVRHGPMVLGVCRRLLPDAGQAEDAFQAAFLVLARKAGDIRRRPLLAAWLYGVAYKVAARLRGRWWRRMAREKPADIDAVPAADRGDVSDLAPAVHEEVQRLPDKYRDPVVLCYLEGRTHEEAARLLDWPLGTVKGRLARARDLLRSRLARRGLAPCEGACAAALAVRPAAPRPAVVDATVRAAPLVAAGDPTGGGLASARAVMLSQGVVRTMMLTNAKIAAAVGLAALLLAGTGGYVYRAARGESGGAQPATKTADKPGGDKATDDAKAIQGTWKVTGVEMGGKDVSGSDEFKDLAKAKWTFTADKITFKSDKPEMSATYKIDPSKKPKEMDVTPLQGPENEKDKKTPAIYSLDGDTLKICVGSPDMPTRPTELASKEEEKNLLITFKRADAAKEKPEAKPGGDKEAIQGAWQVTAVARGGKDVSGDNEYKNLAHAEWVITADKITVKITTPGQPDESAAYTIDPSKEPKELDVNPFLPKGVNEADAPAAPAIYSLEGDVLRICVPEPRLKPVGGGKFELAARPTELTSKGSNLLITLQREKPADKAGNDNEAIQGVWQVTDFEAKGKGPDEAMLKKIKGSKWVFADGQVVVQTPGEKDSPGVVQLDPSKTPKEMDITPPGKAKGEEAIYSLEGDVLKICAPGPEGGPRPTEFAAKEGGKTVVLTLKRVKDDKGKPSDDKEALQGSWRVISLESDGKTQTDHEAEKVKQETWVFTADKLILKIPGPPGAAGQDAECSYKLDATQTPAALDLTPSYGPDKGKTIRAVYSVDGDVLKICHGEGADAERPKEIATKAGGKTTVLTLEREKGDKASR